MLKVPFPVILKLQTTKNKNLIVPTWVAWCPDWTPGWPGWCWRGPTYPAYPVFRDIVTCTAGCLRNHKIVGSWQRDLIQSGTEVPVQRSLKRQKCKISTMQWGRIRIKKQSDPQNRFQVLDADQPTSQLAVFTTHVDKKKSNPKP